MITASEVLETKRMVEQDNLDVRTITMGISLLDCASSDLKETCDKIYNKITTLAKDLVKTGESISREIGIPIVHKRVSVTPVSLVGAACCKTADDYVAIAKTLDDAAKKIGVNFLGSSRHGCGLFKRQRGVHENWHQHGCRAIDGQYCQGQL